MSNNNTHKSLIECSNKALNQIDKNNLINIDNISSNNTEINIEDLFPLPGIIVKDLFDLCISIKSSRERTLVNSIKKVNQL